MQGGGIKIDNMKETESVTILDQTLFLGQYVNDPELKGFLIASKNLIQEKSILTLDDVPTALLPIWVGDYNYTMYRLKYEPLKLTDNDIVSLNIFSHIWSVHNVSFEINDIAFFKTYTQFQTIIQLYVQSIQESNTEYWKNINILALSCYDEVLKNSPDR